MYMIQLDILFTDVDVWIPLLEYRIEDLLKILFYSLYQYFMSVLRYPDYVVLCLIRYMRLYLYSHLTIIPIPPKQVLGLTPSPGFAAAQPKVVPFVNTVN